MYVRLSMPTPNPFPALPAVKTVKDQRHRSAAQPFSVATSRIAHTGIHESEIVHYLDESEIDLTNEEDPEPMPILQSEVEISFDFGSHSSSNSEDETCPGSEISLASSPSATTRCLVRTKGGPRTGAKNDRSLPVYNRWRGNFSTLDSPNFQLRYKFIETDTWTEKDYFEQNFWLTRQTEQTKTRKGIEADFERIEIFYKHMVDFEKWVCHKIRMVPSLFLM